MYLVNHFLDYSLFGILIPDLTAASTTNGEDSIMAQVNECNELYARYPNFILVSLHVPKDLDHKEKGAANYTDMLSPPGTQPARLDQYR